MVSNQDREKFLILLDKLLRAERQATRSCKASDSARVDKARLALAAHVLGQLQTGEREILDDMGA